jgi:hypothetical protein
MRKLEINNKTYLLPGKWNELSKDDLLKFCKINLMQINERIMRFVMLKYFTGLKWNTILTIPAKCLPDVLGIFDYLFEQSQLTINVIGDLFGMKSPEPALQDFTFEQFLGQAEPYAYSIAMGKWNDIDHLLNTLYNYNGTEKNSEKLKKLKEHEKLAIYYFYMGCSNFIKRKFPFIFSGSSDKKTKPDGLEFTRLVNSLNLGDVSRNNQIKENNLYESLQFLTTLIEKHQQNGLK